MVILNDKNFFPDPEFSDADGLVAIGGDLSPQRLLTAYKNGIFPWETEPVIAWYSPDPRCILVPNEVVISKSMRGILNSGKMKFRLNTSFKEVMILCQTTKRKGAQGSWISDDLIESFTLLHKEGYAISAEAWQDEKLVGGLYGIILGKIFFGESMFSSIPNSSKFALIKLCSYFEKQNIKIIDCQVHSDHLESMGAKLIRRKFFLQKLKELT